VLTARAIEFNREAMSMGDRRSTEGSRAGWLPDFLSGMLVGGLFGAVAALVLAPRSGEKRRSPLRKQSTMLFERSAESLDGVVTQASGKAGQVTGGLQNGVGDLHKSVQGLFANDSQ
jgi:gas vesicle protein